MSLDALEGEKTKVHQSGDDVDAGAAVTSSSFLSTFRFLLLSIGIYIDTPATTQESKLDQIVQKVQIFLGSIQISRTNI